MASKEKITKPKFQSFQDTILNLQKYWSKHGCVILQPYDIEVGAGTFHPATTLKSSRPQTMEGSLCPTFKKTYRWKIWRKPK